MFNCIETDLEKATKLLFYIAATCAVFSFIGGAVDFVNAIDLDESLIRSAFMKMVYSVLFGLGSYVVSLLVVCVARISRKLDELQDSQAKDNFVGSSKTVVNENEAI